MRTLAVDAGQELRHVTARAGRCWSRATRFPTRTRLRIRCSVDGETLQDSNTAQLVFGVPRLLAELSAVMTLEPGDIVATGTPAGVGTSRTPRRWLRPGERVRVEIERIGALENPLVAETTGSLDGERLAC